jgi:heme b synthase
VGVAVKVINPHLKQSARNLRSNQTDAEKLLWKYLRSKQLANIKFRRQQPIGNYIVDFVTFDKRLIIELDGGQHAEDKDKDQQRDKWLAGQGFQVLRFWNNDVLGNIEGVLESIMGKLSPSLNPFPGGKGDKVRMIAWEVTRSCNLNCVHCRAASHCGPYAGELSTEKCLALIDEIAAVSSPVIILTGGEPLLRPDIFDIASYGTQQGLRMVMATNGTLVDKAIARKMMESGIQRVSISIDGKDAQSHDAFRGESGAFDGSMRGIEAMKSIGMEFQINTTITTANLHQIQDIHDLVLKIGAAAHHIFLLVPTGRGKDLAEQAITAADYEETLNWFYQESLSCEIQLKATCAPHYFRVMHQNKPKEEKPVKKAGGHFHESTRGCLGGITFCFISHVGHVQPCGYLELSCGNVQKQRFAEIWENSEVFCNLRDYSKYGGKCGRCEFIKVCGGCRARAYEATGDYLAEEPLCLYQPKVQMDDIDKKILNILQKEFPIEEQPFLIIAGRCGISEEEALVRIQKMKDEGIIRRIGAVFDGPKLGRVSTLCAARVPEDKIDNFVQIVNANKGVTHNYRRDHEYNIWFTVSAPTAKELGSFLADDKEKTGVVDILDMRAVRTFKIDASFDV